MPKEASYGSCCLESQHLGLDICFPLLLHLDFTNIISSEDCDLGSGHEIPKSHS